MHTISLVNISIRTLALFIYEPLTTGSSQPHSQAGSHVVLFMRMVGWVGCLELDLYGYVGNGSGNDNIYVFVDLIVYERVCMCE